MAAVYGQGLPFDTQTDVGSFVEQWLPDAFAEQAAAGWPGIFLIYGHTESLAPNLLASTDGQTLQLRAGPKELSYAATLPDGTEQLVSLIQRRDLNGASVGFVALEDDWQTLPDGTPLRTVRRALLLELSLVPRPAYPTTTCSLGATEPRAAIPRREKRQGKVLSAASVAAVEAAIGHVLAGNGGLAVDTLRSLLEQAKEMDSALPEDGDEADDTLLEKGLEMDHYKSALEARLRRYAAEDAADALADGQWRKLRQMRDEIDLLGVA